MSDITFNCPHCQGVLVVDAKGAGRQVNCPECKKRISIPDIRQPVNRYTNHGPLICPSCNVQLDIDEGYYRELAGRTMTCPECKGSVLVPALVGEACRPTQQNADPLRNPSSLRCPSCGSLISDGNAFCSRCGLHLSEKEDKTPAVLSTAHISHLQGVPVCELYRRPMATRQPPSLSVGQLLSSLLPIAGVVVLLVWIFRVCTDGPFPPPPTPVAISNTPASVVPSGVVYPNCLNAIMLRIDSKDHARVKLVTAACSGNAEAEWMLGVQYSTGNGMPKDSVEAFKWLSRSANGGKLDAMYFTGLAYVKGIGVAANAAKACEMFQKGAYGGHAKCYNALGRCSLDGIGTQKSDANAFQSFFKAAELGDSSGQLNLGVCYLNGIGTEVNLSDAHKWFLASAAQGCAEANVALKNLENRQVADIQKAVLDRDRSIEANLQAREQERAAERAEAAEHGKRVTAMKNRSREQRRDAVIGQTRLEDHGSTAFKKKKPSSAVPTTEGGQSVMYTSMSPRDSAQFYSTMDAAFGTGGGAFSVGAGDYSRIMPW